MIWGRLVAAQSSAEQGREGLLLLAAFSCFLLPGNTIRGHFPSKQLTPNPCPAQLPTFLFPIYTEGEKGTNNDIK